MIPDLALAGLGLAILVAGGELLVRGAVNASLRLGIPALVVSLTVVAFGTSAPELLVSVQAVSRGTPGIALGNVVGSNIANVLLVLGLPALVSRLRTGQAGTRRSYLQMLGATALFLLLCQFGPLAWPHGGVLLAVLAVILWLQFREARAGRGAVELDGVNDELRWWRILLYLALGIAGLAAGAGLFVDGAVGIARVLGISEATIGLTLVAIGTSLPELVTSLVAAVRGRTDVALGNVIGSNFFNLLAIVGIASLVGPIPVERSFLVFDLWAMALAALVLAPFALGRGRDLTRRWGVLFLLLYGAYLLAVVRTGGMA